jgi:hypothetical protein
VFWSSDSSLSCSYRAVSTESMKNAVQFSMMFLNTMAQQVSKRREYRRLGIIKLLRPQRSTSASKLVPTRQQGGT